MLLLVVKARLAVQPNALSPFLPTLLFTHHPAGEGGLLFVGWVWGPLQEQSHILVKDGQLGILYNM